MPLLPFTTWVTRRSAARLDKCIGLIAVEAGARADEIDHLPQRDHHAIVEIGVERHGDHVRGRFGQRPFEPHIVAHGETKGADQPGLDRGDADFAIALRAMPVAHGEQRAVGENGKIQSRAGDQLLVVHIAAVAARRRGVGMRPQDAGGATAMTPKKGRSGISWPQGSRPVMRA